MHKHLHIWLRLYKYECRDDCDMSYLSRIPQTRNILKMKSYLKEVKLPVCLLIILFGMGSWVAVNGVWVELPVLVHQLPEGWNLPSYMTVIISAANLGPLVYTIGHLLMPRLITEKPVAYLIIITGTLASILMAFLWQKTSIIGGAEHGLYFFLFLFLISLTDCTSSVVFLPFMNNFKQQYLTSYYIGGGFSGLVPSLVSFAQGVGKTDCLNISSISNVNGTNVTEHSLLETYIPPNFPARDFFLFIFAMMILCGSAFVALNHHPYCKQEYKSQKHKIVNEKKSEINEFEADGPLESFENEKLTERKRLYSEESFDRDSRDSNYDDTDSMVKLNKPVMSSMTYLTYLVFIGWINAMTNGVLISVQSFACLPYGDETYHLAVTFCNIINPVACFLSFFVTVKSVAAITAMTTIGSLISFYIVVIAAYSPEPPLTGSLLGSVTIILAYILVYFLFTFIKVNIASLFHVRGKRSLLWCGVVTQIGSTTGAVAMFITINIYNLLLQNYACS